MITVKGMDFFKNAVITLFGGALLSGAVAAKDLHASESIDDYLSLKPKINTELNKTDKEEDSSDLKKDENKFKFTYNALEVTLINKEIRLKAVDKLIYELEDFILGYHCANFIDNGDTDRIGGRHRGYFVDREWGIGPAIFGKYNADGFFQPNFGFRYTKLGELLGNITGKDIFYGYFDGYKGKTEAGLDIVLGIKLTNNLKLELEHIFEKSKRVELLNSEVQFNYWHKNHGYTLIYDYLQVNSKDEHIVHVGLLYDLNQPLNWMKEKIETITK